MGGGQCVTVYWKGRHYSFHKKHLPGKLHILKRDISLYCLIFSSFHCRFQHSCSDFYVRSTCCAWSTIQVTLSTDNCILAANYIAEDVEHYTDSCLWEMGRNNMTRRKELHYFISGAGKKREEKWGINSVDEKRGTLSEGGQKSVSERQRPQYISRHKKDAGSHKRRHNDRVLYLLSSLGLHFARIKEVVLEDWMEIWSTVVIKILSDKRKQRRKSISSKNFNIPERQTQPNMRKKTWNISSVSVCLCYTQPIFIGYPWSCQCFKTIENGDFKKLRIRAEDQDARSTDSPLQILFHAVICTAIGCCGLKQCILEKLYNEKGSCFPPNLLLLVLFIPAAWYWRHGYTSVGQRHNNFASCESSLLYVFMWCTGSQTQPAAKHPVLPVLTELMSLSGDLPEPGWLFPSSERSTEARGEIVCSSPVQSLP